jgi:peptidoglycan/LPS O-acetylase OafA/YrhL
LQKTGGSSETGDRFDAIFLKSSSILCVLGLIIAGISGHLAEDYVAEVMIGVVGGIPLVSYLSRNPREFPFNRVCGDFSYGVFLGHFLSLWCFMHFFPLLDVNSMRVRVMVILLSLALSIPGIYWIEKPLFRYRKQLTKVASQG